MNKLILTLSQETEDGEKLLTKQDLNGVAIIGSIFEDEEHLVECIAQTSIKNIATWIEVAA